MSLVSAISRVLPPPAYLTLPSVGVDISDTSMKYIFFARDTRSGQNLLLKEWGDIAIPEGTLTRGNVHEAAPLVAALKEVKKKTGVSNVRVSLPEERAYLFETEVKKGTPYKEIRGLLEFKLEENVPLSPRDAFFDYEVLDGIHKNDPLRVAVTVYSRETIMGYYEACRAAGVTPMSFEVEAQAIARASLPANDRGTHLVVDFGKTRTGIGIVHQGILMYTSTIDIGGASLSTALRRQLGEKPEKELTVIKNTQGLIPGVEDASVSEALMSTMSAIKDEIALRIQYWETHDSDREEREIDSIILCGGSSNLKGLPAYLEETLKIQTTRASVWKNAFDVAEAVPPIDQPHSLGYATAIGLGLTSLL